MVNKIVAMLLAAAVAFAVATLLVSAKRRTDRKAVTPSEQIVPAR